MALSPAEDAALAVIRANFSRPALYARADSAAIAVSIIPSETVSNEIEGPGDHGRRRSFEVPFAQLSAPPDRGDVLLYDASAWVVIDFTERRDVQAWELYIIEQDKFLGDILIERGAAEDDGYTSGQPADWAPLMTAIAIVVYGTGEEQREAAREVAVIPATFKLQWTPEHASIRATDRLRYPVDDQGEGPIWNIQAVTSTGLNEAVEIVARRAPE